MVLPPFPILAIGVVTKNWRSWNHLSSTLNFLLLLFIVYIFGTVEHIFCCLFVLTCVCECVCVCVRKMFYFTLYYYYWDFIDEIVCSCFLLWMTTVIDHPPLVVEIIFILKVVLVFLQAFNRNAMNRNTWSISVAKVNISFEGKFGHVPWWSSFVFDWITHEPFYCYCISQDFPSFPAYMCSCLCVQLSN